MKKERPLKIKVKVNFKVNLKEEVKLNPVKCCPHHIGAIKQVNVKVKVKVKVKEDMIKHYLQAIFLLESIACSNVSLHRCVCHIKCSSWTVE